jgi:hypothetical protein
MPYEIRFDSRPAGYALEGATGEGQPIRIAVREFTSSEDGELFISRLEGLPTQILRMLPPDAAGQPSAIDHLVAIIRQDLSTTVYVNECELLARVRAARSIAAGESVREDDIVDIESLQFRGVEMPPDAAVVCVFSYYWRKGFFFDVTPLGPGSPRREYDIERLLGSYYAYLSHQSVFHLGEAAWRALIDQRWFPFVSLPKALVRNMVARARGGQQIDELLPDIAEAVKREAVRMADAWARSEVLQPHIGLLRHAVDEFLEGDHVSATAILYPRIEGLLRSAHEALGTEAPPSQRVLSSVAIEARRQELHEYSWLLPDMFRRYLEQAYFAHFAPGAPATLSRHSVAHGVAVAADFGLKAACIGLLIVHQLFYFLPSRAPAASG